MPWRLLGFIILFAVFLVFIGFNLENNCTISFGFIKFESVPVYLTAFASFVFGMLCAIPFAVFFRLKKKQQKAEKAKTKETILQAADVPALEQAKPEKTKAGRKTKNAVTEINPDDYGIN